MKAIANTLLACCCLLLLIGCQKEQQYESGIIWTRLQNTWTSWGEQTGILVAAFHLNGYENEYIGADGYLNYYHKDDYDYYLYFKITRDTLNQHELCCIGGEETPVFHKGDLFLDSLLIPEKITVNIPFDNGYRTVTFTVTEIGDAAFRKCSSLTSIILPSSIQNIGYHAFEGCSSLTSITLPNSIQNIDHQAFEGCSSLTSITFPNSIQNIGYQAFEGCSSLSSITLPGSIQGIGHEAFEGCSLETIITTGDTIREDFMRLGFQDCLPETVSLILSEGLIHIGKSAFSYCPSLISVSFPNSIQVIGEHAFEGCSSLTSITLPNSIQDIGFHVFSNCSSLTSISLPNSIQVIGDNDFFNCSSLTSISLPDAIQEIGYSAFKNCSSLNTCICYAKVPPTLKHDHQYPWGGDLHLAFDDCPLQAIYVPRESVEAYKTAEGWRNYYDIIYPIE